MLIRPANAEDIPSLILLAQQSATAAHWTEAQYRTALLGESPRRIILVAESASGRVKGFLVGSEVAGEWELENIVVDAAAQGRGQGARLLNALIDSAKNSGGHVVFLEVRSSNSAARALYEKCGFQVSGKRPGYYHNPAEDAILYKKNF
jgi:ribosomal-protein-alanine N-acetyltransferase